MKKCIAAISIVGVCSIVGGASADVINFDDPGVFSPFDNAQVQFKWVDSHAGYTGELNWINPDVPRSPTTMWTNKSAIAGQTFIAPRLYAQGERVDFSYEVIRGHKDLFASNNENDWSQFVVDASNPLDVMVGVEDIRYPRGDMDHNDAVFRVLFSQTSVPSPGSLALLGGGCMVMMRRRRG